MNDKEQNAFEAMEACLSNIVARNLLKDPDSDAYEEIKYAINLADTVLEENNLKRNKN